MRISVGQIILFAADERHNHTRSKVIMEDQSTWMNSCGVLYLRFVNSNQPEFPDGLLPETIA
jgi:hypothetical protein